VKRSTSQPSARRRAGDSSSEKRRQNSKPGVSFDDLKAHRYEDVLIEDENAISLQLNNVTLSRSRFVRVRCKAAKIKESQFVHCIFEDCYFRGAEFSGVNLTGSYFKDCNLHKTSFQGCCLWYVRFHRCSLDYDAILRCIPTESSIAVPLLRSLRSNALEMGEKGIADRILVCEIGKQKAELANRFRGISDYYRTRFGTLERIVSLARLIGLTLSGWLWGYGLKLTNLFASAFAVILAFSLWMYKYGRFHVDGGQRELGLDFAHSIYVSVVTFTTLGCDTLSPASSSTHVAYAAESFFGVLFLGFLAAATYRRFSR